MARVNTMVYVLATKDFKYVKIGSTISPRNRLSNIQTACPFELFLWTSVRTFRLREIESELHLRFAEWRTHGEWFSLPSDKLDELHSRVAELNALERQACITSSET